MGLGPLAVVSNRAQTGAQPGAAVPAATGHCACARTLTGLGSQSSHGNTHWHAWQRPIAGQVMHCGMTIQTLAGAPAVIIRYSLAG